MTNGNESTGVIVIPISDAGKEGYVPSDGIGLTKREYFAAMAMQGILANQTYDNWDNYEVMAKDACNAADAIITELNKQTL